MLPYWKETERAIESGEYKEAHKRVVWFFDHAAEHEKGLYGVRLSGVLRTWHELGMVYKPARDSYIERRDFNTEKILNGDGSSELFHEIESMNKYLGQELKTIKLFKTIEIENKSLAKHAWHYIKDTLFEFEEYKTIKKYIGNPLREYTKEEEHLNTLMNMDLAKNTKSHIAYAEDRFAEKTLQLVNLSLELDDIDMAEEILKRSSRMIDDFRLRNFTIPQK